jgi:hypothetical protein
MIYILVTATIHRIKNFKGKLTLELRNSSEPIFLDHKVRKINLNCIKGKANPLEALRVPGD